MYTVFVTGPLASGKRSACLYLAQKGFSHIDADDIAKEFLNNEEIIHELVNAYGSVILDESGCIDRTALAKKAFASANTSLALNELIWPLVKIRLSDLITNIHCQKNSKNEKLLVEIAMLAEAPDHIELADTVLCITAAPELRLKRAVARGMSFEDARNRMSLQASDEDRAAISDFIIENNGTLESLYRQLDTWMTLSDQEHLF